MSDSTQSSLESPYRWAKRMDRLKPSAIREILKTTEAPNIISFAGGLPAPELFPVEDFARACAEVLADDRGAALQYSTTEGYRPLREWVCEHLARTIHLTCSPDQILITNGSQQGLDLIGKVMLDPGDIVLMENPAYLGALQAFESYEASIVGIPSDKYGIQIDALEKALRESPTRPKFLYLIPNFQNPTGVTMSLDRRIHAAQLAAEFGVPIVEDDPYGRLRYSGEEIPSITSLGDPRNCVYLGTSSKIMAPGMRVAWMLVSNPDLYERLIPAKQAADLHTSTFTQRVVWKYASRPGVLNQHTARLIETYRNRRDTMLRALEESMPAGCSWTQPQGGLFLWMTVPPSLNTVELLKLAMVREVAFVPGSSFWVGGQVHNTLRLNFSNASEEKIVDGIARLAQTFRAAGA